MRLEDARRVYGDAVKERDKSERRGMRACEREREETRIPDS